MTPTPRGTGLFFFLGFSEEASATGSLKLYR